MAPGLYRCDGKKCTSINRGQEPGWMIVIETSRGGLWERWDDVFAERPGCLHACGQECYIKIASTIASAQAEFEKQKVLELRPKFQLLRR